ncbi:MAG: SpoIIE family protein phosphatase [Tepidisphaera sp.]|nr:SpoIIE family protein phosphatase [Tepidisphaera sp.]
MTSAARPYTSDFSIEFEAETQRLLRRRFLWFSGILSAFKGAVLVLGVVLLVHGLRTPPPGAEHPPAPEREPLGLALQALSLGVYLTCFWRARRGIDRGEALLRLTYFLVVADGVLSIATPYMGVRPSLGLIGVMLIHFGASCFLPWTPVQAARPLVPLLLVSTLLALSPIDTSDFGTRIEVIALSPLVGAPGLLMCWLRHSQRVKQATFRFLERRYGEVRRELIDARRLHESLFPAPITRGRVRVAYAYAPMQQIGGDFLFVHGEAEDGPLDVVVLDVTGHGIAAALTVNRIWGELQRIYAEQPGVGPGEVMRLLNRYAHLTLARHSVYLTAFCMRVDPAGDRVEYCSAGHPPAFIRAANGTLHELESTTLVLGVCADKDFHPEPGSTRLGAGETVIVYTDGAIEAMGMDGRCMGIDVFRRVLAGMQRPEIGGWPGRVIEAVEHYRDGPPTDDTLVVEVSRPLVAAD